MRGTFCSAETLSDLLELRASTNALSTGIRVESSSGYSSVEWGRYLSDVNRRAVCLKGLGVCRGSRVAILLSTSLEYELMAHAVMRLGGVVIGLEGHSTATDVSAILLACNTKLLVTSGSYASLAEEADVTVLYTDNPNSSVSQLRSFVLPYVLGQAPSDVGLSACAEADDLATIIFTSGTTGEPKGIGYSHRQILTACQSLTVAYSDLGEGDRTICWLPLSHLFQRMANLFSMSCGMTTYFVQDPKRIMYYLINVRPTFLIGVPRFFEKLDEALMSDEIPELRDSLRDLKYMVSGSAPLSLGLISRLQESGVLVLEAYGLSENTVPVALNRATSYRFGSVGKPLAPNIVRLGEHGESEGEGEVEVSGVGVFSGYLGSDNSDCFTVDGYYKTGDLGRFDEDGFLFLTGRIRDIIKTSTGRRIGPTRIEQAYSQCDFVDQIIVVGNNRKYLGALITLSKTNALPEAELLSRLQAASAELSEHEQVQVFGVLPRPFSGEEVTASQKLKRRVIQRNYADLLDRMYSVSTPAILMPQPGEIPSKHK